MRVCFGLFIDLYKEKAKEMKKKTFFSLIYTVRRRSRSVMVESIIGIRGKDFVLLAQDANTTKYGILNMKFDTNRLFKLSEHCAMLAGKRNANRSKNDSMFLFVFIAGEPGDVVQFSEYVGKNIQLYKMINGIELSPFACANFTRNEMAKSLRSRNSFLANLVVAGYSTNPRDQQHAQLYSIDYLGAMVSANVVAHGFCQFFALAIGDRMWKEDLTVNEALTMLQTIVNELGKRMAAYPHCIFVRMIDARGIHVMENMYPEKIHVAKPTEGDLQTTADMMDIHS